MKEYIATNQSDKFIIESNLDLDTLNKLIAVDNKTAYRGKFAWAVRNITADDNKKEINKKHTTQNINFLFYEPGNMDHVLTEDVFNELKLLKNKLNGDSVAQIIKDTLNKPYTLGAKILYDQAIIKKIIE